MGILSLELVVAMMAVSGGTILVWQILRSASKPKKIQKRSRLLRNAEKGLFEQLSNALSDSYLVFPKVAMSDVIEVDTEISGLSKSKAIQFLRDERFDFVLCHRETMAIYGVVELEHSKAVNDSTSKVGSKMAKKQEQRNELISQLCEDAKLRVFFFDARQAQSYKNMDLCRLITGRSKRTSLEARMSPTHQSQLEIESPSLSIVGSNRTCPKCRSELVTKVAMKGSDIGEKYLMCRKYPYCDYRLSMNDTSSLHKIKQRESRDAMAKGYNKWS